jgi:hypothetical protein
VSDLQLEATLICPLCGFEKAEVMPTDACQFFYECEGCGELLRPQPGDCCVFCSHADVSCPPCQQAAMFRRRLLRLAFQRLLQEGEAVARERLAADAGTPLDEVDEALATLERRGRVRVDDAGRVTASMGLSIVPSRHEITFGGRRRYTWCAYDTIGILAALRADGHIRSRTPFEEPVEITVREGVPGDSGDVVLFLPAASLDAIDSVVDEWCPHANFFLDSDSASRWASTNGVDGRQVPLLEAAGLGRAEWSDCCGATVD